MMLHTATRHAPAAWRQSLRAALVTLAPKRLLFASGPPASRAVSLTFDDGPHPTWTPVVLRILREHGVRATFFLQGSNVAACPEIVREMARDGHAIGHHSWSHGEPSTVSASDLAAETARTRALLTSTIGIDSRIFRPPHGKLTVAKAIRLWGMGQTIVLWTSDPGDVFQASGETLTRWFSAHPPRSGEVVLLHDTTAVMAEALPRIIQMVREARLGFATVSEWVSGESSE